MKESFETQKTLFRYPDILSEKGEFDRVSQTFNLDSSVLFFSAQKGNLVPLEKGMWNILENTDSIDIDKAGWDEVKKCSESQSRDWEALRDKLLNREELDASIVMKFGERYHLVSGNTRLMVAKAAGIIPNILLFEIESI